MAMARGKKTPARPPGRQKPFNAPFAEVGKELKKRIARQEKPAPAPQTRSREPADDAQAFMEAMADVKPLPGQGRVPAAAGNRQPHLEEEPDPDLEVLAHLAELVAGGPGFDLRLTDEYQQGHLPGLSPELLERLAQGDFPLQDHLNLRGLTLEQAQQEAERFIKEAATRGLRHVLLVHGRGLSSPEGVPVLKTGLARWLGRKAMRRWVLAFCTAQPRDGGAGAMYVLLRRWSGPGG